MRRVCTRYVLVFMKKACSMEKQDSLGDFVAIFGAAVKIRREKVQFD